MKRTSKLLWTLLLAAITAIALVGCGSAGDSPALTGLNPEHITTDWQVFYIKAVDASRPDGTKNLTGLERWHFHNNTYDGPIGIEIQKIFVSETAEKGKIPAGAQMVVDFTLDDPNVEVYDPPFTETGVWTIANGKASTGAREDKGYKYLGNVGTSIGASTVYWGFVIKNVSATATAESIRMGGDGATLQNKGIIPLATWFGLKDDVTEPIEPPSPPEFVDEWKTVWIHLSDDTEIMEFHVNTGYVEIKKILGGDVDSEDDAFVAFDFSATPTHDNDNFYWGADDLDAFVSGGNYVLSSGGDYKAGGRFGAAMGGKYIGFVLRSPTANELGLGDTRIRVGKVVDEAFVEIEVVRFSALEEGGFDLTEWMVAWVEIEGSPDAVHFHGGAWNLGPSYVEIQKIFISTSKSMDDAVYLFDFTDDPPYSTGDGTLLYWADLGGRADEGLYVYTNDDGAYQYGGGFGTPAISDNNAVYMGFFIKTNTKGKSGLGDFRVALGDPVTAFQQMEIEPLPISGFTPF
jgi:hypothetical protein